MKKKYLKHILYSGIIGVVFWLVGEALYNFLTKDLWQPLGIALYFCIFGILMIVGMFLLAVFRGDYNKALNKGINPITNNFAPLVLLMVVFFICTGFLEFLYEIGGTSVIKEPTSYVFLIDDSGSMSANDPNCERATAIKKIMEKQDGDFPYSVYSFTSGSKKLKELGPYSQEDNYQFSSNGGTDIIGSLDSVLNEIIADSAYGESPRIMLVSDGSSSSSGIKGVITKCNDNSVSISSISFGDIFGNALLNKLATRTGGVYVSVDNVDELYNEMQMVITSNSVRNLVSERYVPRLNWLYAILRIVFLVIMALLWSIIKNISYCGVGYAKEDKNYSYDNVILFTLVSALISILIMEFGTAYFAIPEKIARLILAVLWAIVPGEFFKSSKLEPILTSPTAGKPGFGESAPTNTLQGNDEETNNGTKRITSLSGFQNVKNEGFKSSGTGFEKPGTSFGPKKTFGGFSGADNLNKKSGGFGNSGSSDSSNGKTNGFGKK